MIIKLSNSDLTKYKKLANNQILNNDIIDVYSKYLENPCIINETVVKNFSNENNLSTEYTFYLLFISFLEEYYGIDKKLENDYIKPTLKLLNKDAYQNNPYYKNIKVPNITYGKWKYKSQTYKPYEVFVYKDIDINDHYKELPNLGYFSEEFSYPSVEENSHEWMAIKPNEIETMKYAIEKVSNNVITYGLGMGYFAYMASLKEDVKSITIIEHDKNVIELFKKYILPQFSFPDKIKIIECDAFSYDMNDKYDYAFVDLWHDVSDGLELYLKMKKIEEKNHHTKFLYWIEESILSYLRKDVFINTLKSMNDKNINDNELIRRVGIIMKNVTINSYDDITYYLSNEYLKKLAYKL